MHSPRPLQEPRRSQGGQRYCLHPDRPGSPAREVRLTWNSKRTGKMGSGHSIARSPQPNCCHYRSTTFPSITRPQTKKEMGFSVTGSKLTQGMHRGHSFLCEVSPNHLVHNQFPNPPEDPPIISNIHLGEKNQGTCRSQIFNASPVLWGFSEMNNNDPVILFPSIFGSRDIFQGAQWEEERGKIIIRSYCGFAAKTPCLIQVDSA